MISDKEKKSPIQEIRKAVPSESEKVRSFYHALIDGIKGSDAHVKWQKDVYPSPDYLRSSIEQGTLYIGTAGDKIIACMVVNHECNEAYAKCEWPVNASPDEVSVIHALGVSPLYFRKGCAAEMVAFAIELSRRNNQKCMRLDVLCGNTPAERLYEGFGFRKIQTLPMFYEDTGLTEFELYELEL